MSNLIKILLYSTDSDKKPFIDWLGKRDAKVKAILAARLARVRLSNFGDCKIIKGAHGVWELRISYGPGYRIYFGKQGTEIVILLIGGDKKSQARDIAKAKEYWRKFKEDNYE